MVATVFTVYGIESIIIREFIIGILNVATVLTVYGIETHEINHKIVYHGCNSVYRLRY